MYEKKTFRENYKNKPQKNDIVSVTFLKKEEDNTKDAEIEMFMDRFSNQRFPEEE